MLGALQMEVLGSFQTKSSKTSKPFILYNEMLAPYLPEKITKVGQPIAYVDIATKNYEQFKKALVAKSSQE